MFAGEGGDDLITLGMATTRGGWRRLDDVLAGDGDSVVFGDHGDVFAEFTAESTTVAGSMFAGEGGNDLIIVGDGDDVVVAGDGFDDVFAGDGDNVVFGDHGDVFAEFTADSDDGVRRACSPARAATT